MLSPTTCARRSWANKPRLIRALQRNGNQQARVCGTCKGTEFGEQPANVGGGLVCVKCHPDSQDLLAAWERRGKEATTPVALEPERYWLLEWGLNRGCPLLPFRDWMAICGTPHAWHQFVLAASRDDLEAAVLAAKSHPQPDEPQDKE